MKKRWKLAGLGLLAIGLLYLLVTCQTTTRLMRRDIQKAQEKTRELYFLPGDGYVEAEKRTGSHFPQVRYLQNYIGYPVYSNTLTQYLSPGEAYHEAPLEQLEKEGIECAIFNPFRPLPTAKQNNRDHRKIVVIDGKIDFTGGINLAGPIGMLLGVPAASEGSHCG